jgi:phospholipase/lecithinase/hemolysin
MMTRRIVPICCGLFVAVALCPDAQARTWEALYTFGDSYTDSGAGYVDGNGPTAVVYLAASLKIPFTYAGAADSSGKSLNFAVSDAKTGSSDGYRVRPAAAGSGIREARFGLGMRNQVLDFAERVRSGTVRFKAETTLFCLAGGLNDGALPTTTTISNLEDEIRRLYQAGGRYFLVALLPTKIPSFSDVGVRLNPALAAIPNDMRATLPQARVGLSNWGRYYDDVIESPAQYGIANTANQCAGRAVFGEDPTPCAAPETYFYFHDGHPSTTVHRIVARQLEREVHEAFE